jgi:hypothetical protein
MQTKSRGAGEVPQSDPDLLIGTAQIARFLGINIRQVGTLAKSRGLPLAEIGHYKTTTRAALLRWVESQAEKRNG